MSARFQELRNDQLFWLTHGMCPDCQRGGLLAGPRGGDARNIKCADLACGPEFNVPLPWFAQRISEPQPLKTPAPATPTAGVELPGE